MNKVIFLKENILMFFLIILVFFLDRYSKIFMVSNLNENLIYINDFINFDLIWNTGIGFGFLSSSTSLIYNTISGVVGIIVIALIYISLKSDKFDKTAFSLIIGGALGNFYDRIFFNAVPDFIDIHYGNFHWFTFNIADFFITIGVICFIIKGFFIKDK
tara:strand:+ start:282 stop:758 length:477 start_codon:yes stop_codon:yes gene_type:complete